MKACLLDYNGSIVGVRIGLFNISYDFSINRLRAYFISESDLDIFLKQVNNGKLKLKYVDGKYVTDDELNGKKVIEVTDDVMACNILVLYDRDKKFNIGKQYKYKPAQGYAQFDAGSILTVIDVDFGLGKVIVETENKSEYIISLNEI